jgi:hypothetical protein
MNDQIAENLARTMHAYENGDIRWEDVGPSWRGYCIGRARVLLAQLDAAGLLASETMDDLCRQRDHARDLACTYEALLADPAASLAASTAQPPRLGSSR